MRVTGAVEIRWTDGSVGWFRTYDDAVVAIRERLPQAEIGHNGDVRDGGARTLFWESAQDAAGDAGANAAGAIYMRPAVRDYVAMVGAAGQLASDIYGSLPAGDDVSAADQVDAQSDPAGVALRHGWPAGEFRELVIEALSRFQNRNCGHPADALSTDVLLLVCPDCAAECSQTSIGHDQLCYDDRCPLHVMAGAGSGWRQQRGNE